MHSYIKERKNCIFGKLNNDTFVIVLICVLFNVIGILLTRNEVFLDDWYIEGSADGLFGEDNTSLFVVGTNYVLTFIIHLLSLTGIRIFWLHILLVLMNFISSLFVCLILKENTNGWYKYFTTILFMLFITPLVSFYFQFTTTAACTTATGCLVIFNALTHKKKKKNYTLGIFLIILGACLRIDCIYFSLYFMGLVWLIYIVRSIRKCNSHKTIKKVVINYFIPFFLALVVIVILELSQQILMDKASPGFKSWNETRSYVDDYEIPDYLQNYEKYNEIGMSYNDYQILKSWNNIDPDFFTEELYQQIKNIKDEQNSQQFENIGFYKGLINNINVISGNILFWIFLLTIIVIGLFFSIGLAVDIGILFTGMIILSTYFSFRGRLIWRTEWPIWIVLSIAIIALFVVRRFLINLKSPIKRKDVCITILLAIVLLVLKPIMPNNFQWDPYKGNSLFEIYFSRANSEDTYGKYIFDKILQNTTYQSDTIDGEISECLENNKDKIYYRLWTRDWLQQYPLTDRDIFRTAPIGAGENWGSLGQYIVRLKPLQNILKNYDITNSFKDLIKENVRVVVKDQEVVDRTKEINQYLREHYYEDANFSVDEILDNAVVGRYMRNINTDGMKVLNGKFSVGYQKDSEYEGMGQVDILDQDIEYYEQGVDEAYIKLIRDDGTAYTFTILNDDTDCIRALIYNDILIEGEEYTVQFIFNHQGSWFIVNSIEKIQLRTICDENAIQNLDIKTLESSNNSAISGFYEIEGDHVWTHKYSMVKLNNSSISKEGLKLKLRIWDFTSKGTEPIRIFVNGQCVYEMGLEEGEYEILIPAEKIKNLNNRYIIEMECPYYVNPAKELNSSDDRNLCIMVYYIGNPSAYTP